MSYNAILDSSIMQKGLPATAGSKMLADFISPIDATVVTRLVAAGVQIAGRCDVGEFGCQGDGSLDNICRKINISCQENRPPDNLDFALCNDYTGALSLAAAKNGLYYIHPTYGTVSRYGLIPAVSSMDQIGILCRCPEIGFEVLKIISGSDSKDGAMRQSINDKGQMTNEKIRAHPLPHSVAKHTEILPQIMKILCCAEIGNNISRYDGIKFGYRAKGYNGLRELYTKSRTEAFGKDVKLAAVIGAMVLSQENYIRYYDKAMRLRRMVRDSFVNVTEVVTEGQSLCHNLLILSRLCGLPSLAAPEGVYVANAGREDVLEAQLCNMK